MGIRFRKSVKIAPGVKLNFNKKSVGVSVGTRGAHYTANSSGRRTATVGVPGTGISYSASSGGGSKRKSSSSSSRYATSLNRQPDNPKEKKSGGCLVYFIALLLICAVIKIFSYAWIPAIIILIVVPFIKTDKKTKIISFITILVVGFASFLTFGWLQTGQTNDNAPETEVISEAEVQTEEITQNITETELITEAPTELQTETELPEETEPQTEAFVSEYYYSTDTVNVRNAPSTDSEIIGSLNKSDKIQVNAINGEWASVTYNGTAAYVAAQYLSETVPQTEASERKVWLPESGSKYHSVSSCSNMNAARQVTVSEAEALGYGPCGKCY